MFKYFSIIFHKIQKNKVNAINKIAGLVIAIVACLLIAFYVNDEFSYDRFQSKKDNVYRLVKNDGYPNPIWPKIMFRHLKGQIPGVEKIADFSNQWEGVFTVNQIPFLEEDIYVADPDILDILDFHITKSQLHKEDLLASPNTMLISQKMAKKFFNDENPVGKTIKYNNQFDMTITGVFKNFPDQSHVNPQFLISSATTLSEYMDNAWQAQGHNAYVLISPKASPQEVAERIKEALCHAGQEANDMFAKTAFSLQPITDIHLFSSDFTWDDAKKGDIDFVLMLLMTGILILLIAGTNHINLTITQTMTETKQFAIMKTMGALPYQIRQYIYAGILFEVVIAVVLATVITLMILPVFGSLVGKQFVLNFETVLYMLCLLIAIVVTVTFIAGVYPAYLFSRIPVMHIFQKTYRIGGENLRKGLIVFQFTVSILLIAGTIFMYRQMQLLTGTKLGFDKEQLLVITNPGNSDKQYELFKTLVDKLPVVKSISSANNAPVGNINNGGSIKKWGATDEELHSCTFVYSSIGFLPTIGAHFIAGNDFTESGTGNQMILSRKLVENLGETPESVIGKEYELTNYKDKIRKVTGVIDDIQYHPYRKKDERSGTVFQNLPWSATSSIVVRTTKGDWRNTVAQLKEAWKQAAPEWPFTYQMMDERLEKSYEKELTDIHTISVFSLVAIILSCFGVMGISYYTTRKRTKEIALRKINGAGKRDIMLLLNSNFMVLNLIAFVIAIPAVILFMNQWLVKFSYKISLSWWVFLLAGLFTSAIILATVSWQSWQAASANPVDSIKTE